MAVARARALQSLQRSLRHGGLRASPRIAPSARTQLAIGRRFASGGGGHGHGEPSSDIPWLAGAVAVTIPSCWYLWPTASPDHGHHDDHAKHDDKHVEAEEKDDAPVEEETSDEKSDDKESDKKDESKEDDKSEDDEEAPSDDSDEKKDGEEESDESETKEKKESTDGATFKGKTKSGKEDTRKTEPDSKGAQKKRIDSSLGKDLGDNGGEASSAKDAKKNDDGDIAKKQHGMSNTPTRHSIEDDRKKELSHKGEGTPETAKSMGTVQIDRPQK